MTAAVFLNFAARFQQDNIAGLEGFLVEIYLFIYFFQNWSLGQISLLFCK